MLVLLIIFMVAAPLLTVGVPLDLPQTRAAALNMDKQPLTISVRADGKIYLMETPIALNDVTAKLQAIAKTGQDERIFVRGFGNKNLDTVWVVAAGATTSKIIVAFCGIGPRPRSP
jgi:biopolymer transport protein TolR